MVYYVAETCVHRDALNTTTGWSSKILVSVRTLPRRQQTKSCATQNAMLDGTSVAKPCVMWCNGSVAVADAMHTRNGKKGKMCDPSLD